MYSMQTRYAAASTHTYITGIAQVRWIGLSLLLLFIIERPPWDDKTSGLMQRLCQTMFVIACKPSL